MISGNLITGNPFGILPTIETLFSPRPKNHTKEVVIITAMTGPVLDIKAEKNSLIFKFIKKALKLFFVQYKIKSDTDPIKNVTTLISEIFLKRLVKISTKLLPLPLIPKICFSWLAAIINPDAVINKRHIKRLAAFIPDKCTWYVSPLKRTIQTAEALSKFVNVGEMNFEEKLVEQNFGNWAGKKISEVWDELKHHKDQHNFSFICPEICPPNGNSFLDQCSRIASFIDTLNFYDQNPIVVIAHAGTIKAFLSNDSTQ